MDEIHEWNERIMALIDKLKNDHPELLKYLDEMQVSIPDDSHPRITIRILQDYYNSLMELENLKMSE